MKAILKALKFDIIETGIWLSVCAAFAILLWATNKTIDAWVAVIVMYCAHIIARDIRGMIEK